MKRSEILVAILMGSDSDAEKMKGAKDVLQKFEIPFATKVISAHRTADDVPFTVIEFLKRGCKVFLCGAGHAAHLAGAVAAQTTRPVVGVPISSSVLKGMDSLLATVQMPPGIPVATMGIDRSDNAAYFAMQLLGVEHTGIAYKLTKHREVMKEGVHKKNDKLIESGWPA
ncbi:MAG: 5-(carboxyamino)imidazole ribonucleotide mutase [Patescibacteria group bacterium]|jgi:phosphoribosylaminoimidazole carboxylase PurE protein|nr:5-(carboxyamino)imidazole ribonucleotide mutase [Patescibacteria group bacterium]